VASHHKEPAARLFVSHRGLERFCDRLRGRQPSRIHFLTDHCRFVEQIPQQRVGKLVLMPSIAGGSADQPRVTERGIVDRIDFDQFLVVDDDMPVVILTVRELG